MDDSVYCMHTFSQKQSVFKLFRVFRQIINGTIKINTFLILDYLKSCDQQPDWAAWKWDVFVIRPDESQLILAARGFP